MANKLLKSVFVLACISTLSACGHIGKAISNEDALLDKAEFATGIDRKYLSVIPGSVQAQIDSVHYKLNQRKAVITAAITQRWLQLLQMRSASELGLLKQNKMLRLMQRKKSAIVVMPF